MPDAEVNLESLAALYVTAVQSGNTNQADFLKGAARNVATAKSALAEAAALSEFAIRISE